jgi:hypothetical protein
LIEVGVILPFWQGGGVVHVEVFYAHGDHLLVGGVQPQHLISRVLVVPEGPEVSHVR